MSSRARLLVNKARNIVNTSSQYAMNEESPGPARSVPYWFNSPSENDYPSSSVSTPEHSLAEERIGKNLETVCKKLDFQEACGSYKGNTPKRQGSRTKRVETKNDKRNREHKNQNDIKCCRTNLAEKFSSVPLGKCSEENNNLNNNVEENQSGTNLCCEKLNPFSKEQHGSEIKETGVISDDKNSFPPSSDSQQTPTAVAPESSDLSSKDQSPRQPLLLVSSTPCASKSKNIDFQNGEPGSINNCADVSFPNIDDMFCGADEIEISVPVLNDAVLLPLDSPDSSLNFEDTRASTEDVYQDSGFSADVSGSSNPGTQFQDSSAPSQKRTRKDVPVLKIGRKRTVNRARWQNSTRKLALNSGKSYVTRKGIQKPERKMEEPCNVGCRFKCRSKLLEKDRAVIFQKFWKLGEEEDGHDRQWYFIRGCMSVTDKLRNRGIVTRRKSSRTFSFRVRNENVKVCKTMFLATLNICDGWIETAVKKLGEGGIISPDKRGRNRRGVTYIKPETTQSVIDHINTFQRVDSHYCRKDSTRQYLEEGLSIRRMFEFYEEWIEEEKSQNGRICEKTATERQYRDIFNSNFNIGFFLPKKDQCDTCTHYDNCDEDAKAVMKEEYELHQSNKEKARALKVADAKLAASKESSHISVACFDYQKDLHTPKGQASVFYYRRKLSIYNLTVYDIGRHEGINYVYNETIATKGPNEVASFVYNFIEDKVAKGVKDFRFYSDNCPSQNRNRFVFAMYVLAAAKFGISIKHVFLEKGHTQNEGDSVHAAIERRCKGVNIYSSTQLCELTKTAKRCKTNPYKVMEVSQDIIFDFKEVVSKQNWKKNEDKIKVTWTKIRTVSSNGNEPGKLKYTLTYDEDPATLNTKTVGHPLNLQTFSLKKAYNELLPLSSAKYKDLVHMCDKNAIPQEYQPAFRSLPYKLPEMPEEEASRNANGKKRKGLPAAEEESATVSNKKSKRQRAPARKRKTKKKAQVVSSDSEESDIDSPDEMQE